MTAIRENYESVLARIQAAAMRVGRDPAEVTLVVVTKTHPVEVVREMLRAGATHIGENRVQEAVPKIESIRADTSMASPHFHLIGHLQSNKAKLAARNFDIIESVDSADLARTLNRHATEASRTLDVLLQVNVSGEGTKSGLEIDEVRSVLPEILRECPALTCRGLMTIAPLAADPEAIRPHFRALHILSEELRHATNGALGPELSMGMTGDFEVAIEEGATIVRIGSAILGSR